MALIRSVVPAMHAQGNMQWSDDYPSREMLARDLANGNLWVAESSSALAGVAAITTDQSPEYADAGLNLSEPAVVVHRLAVDPNFRGAGVGAALMRQAEVVARSRGMRVLRVDTNTQNRATQRLFPNMGYALAGEIGLGHRPGLRFLCYEKRLPQDSHTAAIALGSNLPSATGGAPAENIHAAVAQLRRIGEVLAVSSFYETAPVGYTDQPDFTNAALVLATDLAPVTLMHELLRIEREMGRDRAAVPAKGPRVIDLDLILFDDVVLQTPELTLPHPAMAERRFVLEPLAEIAPDWGDPVSCKTVAEMLAYLH